MDGAAFGRMIVSASAAIELKKQKINELNVFPVPDGDTGTNMSMSVGLCEQMRFLSRFLRLATSESNCTYGIRFRRTRVPSTT